jgi:predicted aspartyl protease
MGVLRVPIQVGDSGGAQFESFDALVDTGSSNTAVPASVLRRLGVDPYRRAGFEMADGQIELDIGRTWIRVNGDIELAQVIFAEEGTQPLLGAITLEELGLGVDPIARRLVPVHRLLK